MALTPGAATAGIPLRRAGLRLANGLLAYGVVSLLVAAAGLMALLWLGGRLDAFGDRATGQIETLVATLEDTSDTLDDAGRSAVSFAVTLERTPPIVRQTATTISNLRANLLSVQAQLAGFTIFGATPLAASAQTFGQMATDLKGLDTRLGLVATDLESNKAALLANSASLRALGVTVRGVAQDLGGGSVEASLDDVRLALTVLALLMIGWAAVPAVGALAFGWWLRRMLQVEPPTGAPAGF